MLVPALMLLLSTGGDPRVPIVELQRQRDPAAALAATELALSAEPETSRALGFDHLKGHLLEQLGRPRDASASFAAALSTAPSIEAYSRFRLALLNEQLRHPEVAAGIIATLLGDGAPRPVVTPAARLLRRTLERGGDCRLLGRMDAWELPVPERRSLELARADCAFTAGEEAVARARLLALLEEDVADGPAREAAQRLTARSGVDGESHEMSILVGLAFHHNREFARSNDFLDAVMAMEGFPATVGHRREFEVRYAAARGRFWRVEFDRAAESFQELAEWTNRTEERANALYQRGRSLELSGRWLEAWKVFREAYLADPTGEWSAAALMSALRLEWRSGREKQALELLEALTARPQWRGTMERAALFLSASDLVRGRTDRARTWLGMGGRARGESALDFAFWRGVLAEAERNFEAAAGQYSLVLAANPHHPLALSARRRLARPGMAQAAIDVGTGLAGSGRTEDLVRAWALLGSHHPVGARAVGALRSHLAGDRRARPFLELQLIPTGEWPLWQSGLQKPGEQLMALGVWSPSDRHEVLRHFPSARPSLAYTGSSMLAAAGEISQALYVAESLGKALPESFPPELLDPGYRRLLYPFPYQQLIVSESHARGIDPLLLVAIIREESRFDPEAFSSASARGLAQFVFPTAERLARENGMPPIEPEDLHRPEVAIALGALYLAELKQQFSGRLPDMLAAYNAGEPQAHLWRSYCYSYLPEEYYTKVGFRQTREYLLKVISSREHYEELWGDLPDVGAVTLR